MNSEQLHTEQETLLLVDDDEVLRERLARAFRERGYDVRTAGAYEAAMETATADPPELAVVDLRMPGRSGLERADHAVDLLAGDARVADRRDRRLAGERRGRAPPGVAAELGRAEPDDRDPVTDRIAPRHHPLPPRFAPSRSRKTGKGEP